MPSEIDILLTATDEASGVIKTATVSVSNYNNSLEKMIAAEKSAIVSADLAKKFASMTEAEKNAFLETQKLARATEELARAEQRASAAATQSESATTRMSQASQLAGNIVRDLGQAYAAYNQLIDATIGKTAAYAAEVSSLSRVTGQSVQETSRVIQVMDDLGVTTAQLEAATKKLAADGLSLNIETLAKLSDEYNNLAPGADRATFLSDKFGKSNLDMAKAMEQGGAALRSMAAEQSGSLILTEAQTAAYEKWTLSVDSAEDANAGIAATIGNILTPSITEFNEAWAAGIQGWDRFIQGASRSISEMQKNSEITQIAEQNLAQYNATVVDAEGFVTGYTEATEEQIQFAYLAAKAQWELTHSTEGLTKVQKDAEKSAKDLALANKLIEETAKAVSDANVKMVGTINSIQAADENYAKASATLAEQKLKEVEKLALLTAQGYKKGEQVIKDQEAAIASLEEKEKELAAERDKQTLQFISNLLLQKLELDGLTTAEFDAFAKQQEAWGLWSADAVAKAKAAWTEADKVAASIAKIEGKTVQIIIEAVAQIDQRKLTPIGGPAQAMASGSPPGGAPGGLTWVGETGRELVKMPKGAQVANSPTSREMSKGGGHERIDYERMGAVLARALTSALARAGA